MWPLNGGGRNLTELANTKHYTIYGVTSPLRDRSGDSARTLLNGRRQKKLALMIARANGGIETARGVFMFRTWKLARVAGIDVSIHWSFLLLLAWLTVGSLSAGAAAVATNLLLTLCVFGCVLLHEFGHALTARRFGIGTHGITILPIGGVARLNGMTRRPMEELAIAIAGPLVNVAIAGALFAVKPLLGAVAGVSVVAALLFELVGSLLWINIGLAVFNMLPAFPMDGGRVLRSVLATSQSYVDATLTAVRIGRNIAIVLAFLGLFTTSPVLILIAAFVFLAGAAEGQMVVATATQPMRFYRAPAPANSYEPQRESSGGPKVVTGELLWPSEFDASDRPDQTMRLHRVVMRSWP